MGSRFGEGGRKLSYGTYLNVAKLLALTALGFGFVVVAVFITLQWLGLPTWASWTGSALAYAAIAYVDCALAWKRHRREYREALEDLKGERAAPSLH